MSREKVEALRIAGDEWLKVINEIIETSARYNKAREQFRDSISEFVKLYCQEINEAGKEWEKGNNVPAECAHKEYDTVTEIRRCVYAEIDRLNETVNYLS